MNGESKPLSRRLVPYWLMGPGLLWLVLFFVIPLYFMARLALESGTLETGFTFSWEWSNFSDAISRYNEQFIRSFVYAGVATLIALVIAYPLAYAIAFRGGRWKNALLFAVVAPFFVTYLIRTIAWTTILSDDGVVVDVLKAVGIVGEDGRVLATPAAVIAGITYNFLPFMVLPIYASLERLDPRLIEGAKDLYSSPRAAFMKVTLPLSAPGIVAGTLLTFIPAAGDYINVLFLGSTNTSMVGNAIQSLYLNLRDYPTAAALSFILMAVIMALVVIYIRFAGSEALMGEEEEAT
ncbi:MAG TPA: ABC transporter permease [Solirubrobacterales bacterium]|jgi:spermidine/putrescine transport system permease protein|nr:ABC transporter permease [Solirubrobacterales bacterium]